MFPLKRICKKTIQLKPKSGHDNGSVLKILTPLDAFFLMQKTITCTYIYRKTIDKIQLERSLSELIKIYPFNTS